MDATNINLIAKNANDHTCMMANRDDAIECAPRLSCKILVATKY